MDITESKIASATVLALNGRLDGLSSPTLENLCLYFAGRLKGEFPGLSRVVVSRPSIGESASLTL